MLVHCSKIHTASVYIELTDLSSSPSFLLRQEVVYPLLEELVIVNDGGVPMRGVSDPLGAPVVAVALKQDIRVKLELLLSAQELPDLGRTLGEQPQALVNIVPEISNLIVRNDSKDHLFVITEVSSTRRQPAERRP